MDCVADALGSKIDYRLNRLLLVDFRVCPVSSGAAMKGGIAWPKRIQRDR